MNGGLKSRIAVALIGVVCWGFSWAILWAHGAPLWIWLVTVIVFVSMIVGNWILMKRDDEYERRETERIMKILGKD